MNSRIVFLKIYILYFYLFKTLYHFTIFYILTKNTSAPSLKMITMSGRKTTKKTRQGKLGQDWREIFCHI